jgi:Tol biopolymer transport system component
MKKLFIISIILLVIILIFLGIYNFAFKRDVPSTASNENNSTITAKPEVKVANLEKIKRITEDGVIGPIFDKKTQQIKYYEEKTGILWSIDAKGRQQLTDVRLPGLKNVLWSPDTSKVLTVALKDGKDSLYMYDYQLQKGVLLKNNLDTAVWDNIGTKIFYKYFEEATKKRTLNIANADGSNWQKISDVLERNVAIAPIPLTGLVSYWNIPNAFEETHLNTISITGGESKNILNGKYGADYLWSPDGSRALVSALPSKDTKTIMLGLIRINGIFQELNLPTFVSKCIWSQDGKSVYYTLPGDIPVDAIMPNDYSENKFNTNDTFWKLDVETGEKRRIIEPTELKIKYDASNLFLSPTEDMLYFVNKIDKRLYAIEL